MNELQNSWKLIITGDRVEYYHPSYGSITMRKTEPIEKEKIINGITHRPIAFDPENRKLYYGFTSGKYTFIRTCKTRYIITNIENGKNYTITPRALPAIVKFLEKIENDRVLIDGAPHKFEIINNTPTVLTILNDELAVARLPLENPKDRYSTKEIEKVQTIRRLPRWLKVTAIFTSTPSMLIAFDKDNIPFAFTRERPTPGYTFYYAGVKEPPEKPKYITRLYEAYKPTNDEINFKKRVGSRVGTGIVIERPCKKCSKPKVKSIQTPVGEVVLLEEPEVELSEWEKSVIDEIINGRAPAPGYRVALLTKNGVIVYTGHHEKIKHGEKEVHFYNRIEVVTLGKRVTPHKNVEVINSPKEISYDGKKLVIPTFTKLPLKTAKKLYNDEPISPSDILPGFPKKGTFKLDLTIHHLEYTVNDRTFSLTVNPRVNDAYFKMYHPAQDGVYEVTIDEEPFNWGSLDPPKNSQKVFDFTQFGVRRIGDFRKIVINHSPEEAVINYDKASVAIHKYGVFIKTSNGGEIIDKEILETLDGDLEKYVLIKLLE